MDTLTHRNPAYEPTPIACAHCDGTGEIFDDKADVWGVKTCTTCNGAGMVEPPKHEHEFEPEEYERH